MLFCNMQTQWTTSFGGFVGLRYEVLLMQGGMFDLYNIKDRTKILEELQRRYDKDRVSKNSKWALVLNGKGGPEAGQKAG